VVFVDFDAEAPLLLLVLVSEEPRDPSPLLEEDWHPVRSIRAARDVTATVRVRCLGVWAIMGCLLSMRDVDVWGVCSRG
jgi:hypothetical protein